MVFHVRWHVAAPVVSFADASNAASSASTVVTVSGVSFGGRDATSSARLGLSSCGTAAWASTTSVECIVVAGQGVGHAASVTVLGIVGTRTKVFSYDGAWDLEDLEV